MCQACSDKKNGRLSQTFGGIEFAFCVSKCDVILIYFMDILSEKGSRTQKLIFRKRQSSVRYAKIDRGRYLCPNQGGFCDKADGFLDKCPLCSLKPEHRSIWQTNDVLCLLKYVLGSEL